MQVTLQNTFGAALLGAVAATLFFGMMVVQVYTYYCKFSKDWIFQKFVVAFLLLLDILHTFLTVLAIYYYLINNFGDIGALQYLSWSFKWQAYINVSHPIKFRYPSLCRQVGIILTVQGLYTWRVYLLGQHFSLIWPGIILTLVAMGWGVGIVFLIKSSALESFVEINKLQGLLKGVFFCPTIIDFAIATAICYYLRTSCTSFQRTNNKIFRIIKYVLISGFLTSACSLSAFIAYVTMPTNFIFLSITFLLPHLYTNSYLAMLNARDNETSFDTSTGVNFRMRGNQQSEFTDVESKSPQSRIDCVQCDMQTMPIEIAIHRTEEKVYEP